MTRMLGLVNGLNGIADRVRDLPIKQELVQLATKLRDEIEGDEQVVENQRLLLRIEAIRSADTRELLKAQQKFQRQNPTTRQKVPAGIRHGFAELSVLSSDSSEDDSSEETRVRRKLKKPARDPLKVQEEVWYKRLVYSERFYQNRESKWKSDIEEKDNTLTMSRSLINKTNEKANKLRAAVNLEKVKVQKAVQKLDVAEALLIEKEVRLQDALEAKEQAQRESKKLKVQAAHYSKIAEALTGAPPPPPEDPTGELPLELPDEVLQDATHDLERQVILNEEMLARLQEEIAHRHRAEELLANVLAEKEHQAKAETGAAADEAAEDSAAAEAAAASENAAAEVAAAEKAPGEEAAADEAAAGNATEKAAAEEAAAEKAPAEVAAAEEAAAEKAHAEEAATERAAAEKAAAEKMAAEKGAAKEDAAAAPAELQAKRAAVNAAANAAKAATSKRKAKTAQVWAKEQVGYYFNFLKRKVAVAMTADISEDEEDDCGLMDV